MVSGYYVGLIVLLLSSSLMIQSLLSSYVSLLNIIYSIVFEDPLAFIRYLQLDLV